MAEVSAGSFAPSQSAVTPPVTPVSPRGLDPSAENERALPPPEESQASNNDSPAEAARRRAEEAEEEAGQREEDDASQRQEQARNGSRVDVTV